MFWLLRCTVSDEEVMYLDSADNALEQLDLVTREVYLPLLCTDQTHMANSYGISADKVMDLLHRLMAHLETTQGHVEVSFILQFLILKRYCRDNIMSQIREKPRVGSLCPTTDVYIRINDACVVLATLRPVTRIFHCSPVTSLRLRKHIFCVRPEIYITMQKKQCRYFFLFSGSFHF